MIASLLHDCYFQVHIFRDAPETSYSISSSICGLSITRCSSYPSSILCYSKTEDQSRLPIDKANSAQGRAYAVQHPFLNIPCRRKYNVLVGYIKSQ
ncbi:hypothetical protein DPSP01_006631 [Paraphaeosphaeria sporulosa]